MRFTTITIPSVVMIKLEKAIEKQNMKKSILALLTVVAFSGCNVPNTIPVNDYTKTNLMGSRFTFVSSDYYRINCNAANFAVTVLSDAKGTNDILVTTCTGGGVSVIYIPKPIKQLESNR
jgi:hypothetical protein